MNFGMLAAGAASGAAQGFMMNKLGEKLKAKKAKASGVPSAVSTNPSLPSAQEIGAADPVTPPTTIGSDGAPDEPTTPLNPIAQADDDQAEMASYFRQFAGPNYGQG